MAVESTTYLHHLYRKQKKAVRIISFSKWNAHAKPLFLLLNLLTVYDINKLQIYCFVYKAFKGHLPKRFCNLFTRNMDIHSHNTRQVSDIHIIPHSTKARAYSIRFNGTTLWNLLGSAVINSPTIYVFKRRCKMLLFHNLALYM